MMNLAEIGYDNLVEISFAKTEEKISKKKIGRYRTIRGGITRLTCKNRAKTSGAFGSTKCTAFTVCNLII